MRCTLLVTLFLSATPAAQSGDLAKRSQAAEAIGPLERAVAARPADVESRRRLAAAYAAAGRRIDAVSELSKVTDLAPQLPGAWYDLGQAYNAIKQEALSTFERQSEDASWRQLLAADALLARGKWTDAFALYRASLERLPSMVSIHDSVARIYERTGHPEWAARERAHGTLSTADCARRQALCEFRAGQFRSALSAALAQSDSESQVLAGACSDRARPRRVHNISTSSPTRPNGERCAPRWRAQRNATTTRSWSSKLR